MVEDQKNKYEVLGELATGIIHTVNSPLMAISLMSDKIKGLIEDHEELGEDLDVEGITNANLVISKTIKEIAPILHSINEFMRKESQEAFSLTEISSIVNKVKAITYPVCYNNKINLEFINKTEGNDFRIKGNPNTIAQVIINCVKNSVEAILGKEDSWVSISFEIINTDLIIKIQDSGKMDTSVKEQIFKPEFSTKDSTKGIGLPFSRELIHQINGEIKLLNDENTTIEVSLPLVA